MGEHANQPTVPGGTAPAARRRRRSAWDVPGPAGVAPSSHISIVAMPPYPSGSPQPDHSASGGGNPPHPRMSAPSSTWSLASSLRVLSRSSTAGESEGPDADRALKSIVREFIAVHYRAMGDAPGTRAACYTVRGRLAPCVFKKRLHIKCPPTRKRRRYHPAFSSCSCFSAQSPFSPAALIPVCVRRAG